MCSSGRHLAAISVTVIRYAKVESPPTCSTIDLIRKRNGIRVGRPNSHSVVGHFDRASQGAVIDSKIMGERAPAREYVTGRPPQERR
jgi:hypothetical protein